MVLNYGVRVLYFLFFIVLVSVSTRVSAQVFTTVQDGPWEDPATWGDISTPDAATSTAITIAHAVSINTNVSIDQTTISATGSVEIVSGVEVTIVQGAGTDLTVNGSIDVFGTLILSNQATHSGTNGNNVVFQENATYEHRYMNSEGAIPLASWNAASNLLITGYTTFGGPAASAGGNWSQSFGNVTWNCPAQVGSISLEGLFAVARGDFEALSTGTGILRFTRTGVASIDIDGTFTVNGTSRVVLTSTGNCTIDVDGDYIQNTTNYFRFADGLDGVGTLNITGNFDLLAGGLTETGSGLAQGNVNFVGSNGTSHTFTALGTGVIAQLLSYSVADNNELIAVGESQLVGTGSFTLGAGAIFHAQSTDVAGAIQIGSAQNATAGNLRVTTRIFGQGSQIVYDGPGPQFLGNGHPAADFITVINNASGVTLLEATNRILGNLLIQSGNLNVSNASLTVSGTTEIQSGNIIFTTTSAIRSLIFNGDVSLGDEIMVSSGTANANVTFGGDVSGGSTISFSGVNTNLILNGSGDVLIPFSGSLETVTSNRSGTVIFNQDLNVNTSTVSAMNITAGAVQVTGAFNGRNITLTNGSALTVTGNTVLTNSLNITDGVVQTDGTLSIANDLIITAGSLDANGEVTLTDDLTLGTGSIFYFEDETVTLNSQLINNGGFFSCNAVSALNILNTGVLGTIAFDGGGNTLGTLTLNRPTSGTLVTLSTPLTITSALNLLDGIFLNTSGLDLGDGAVVTRHSNASFAATSAVPTGGAYDLLLTGVSMTTGVETSGVIRDITSTASGTVTLGGPMSASGDLVISSGSFTCGANSVSVLNDLINNGTTFTAPAGTTLAIGGDLVNNGTFNRGTTSSTVEFTGASTITGAVNPLFQNLTISGTLIAPASLTLAGNFTNDGSFNEGTGTVIFTSTTAATKVIGGSASTTFHNITIQNTSAVPDVSVSGVANLSGVLTLVTNAILDADGDGSGVFTILSSADNPVNDGAVATMTGTSAITGNVTVQRFMAIEGPNNNRIYRYISSPVQGATVADIQNEIPVTGSFTGTSACTQCTTSQSMFLYDESVITDMNGDTFLNANDGYVHFPAETNSEVLTPGRGYYMYVLGSILSTALWDVRGVANQGVVSLPVTYTASPGTGDGWNLVGNPYPSTIDWNSASWTKTNIGGTIYMRDNGNGGQYATWNGTVGTNGGSRYIPTGQAFWVVASAASPVLTARENVKAAGQSAIFFREASLQNIVRLTLEKDNVRDETIIHFREDGSDFFDPENDAKKLFNTTFNLSTIIESGERLAINSLEQISCSKIIQLDINGVTPGTYLLNFEEFNSFDPSVGIMLRDKFLNREHDIRSGANYTFDVTSDDASFGAHRFVIEFKNEKFAANASVLSVESCVGDSVSITVENSQQLTMYQAFYANQQISDALQGNSGNLELRIKGDNLKAGLNQITILAHHNVCGTTYTYPATIVLHKPAGVVIEDSGNGILSSSVETGNQWYFNDELIEGATSKEFAIIDEGKYTVMVASGGCSEWADFEFTITGTEDRDNLKGIMVYPNPVNESLRIQLATDRAEDFSKIAVFTITGKEMTEIQLDNYPEGKKGAIDVSNYPTGIYIVKFFGMNKVSGIKIFKQ
ncbi:MAG TPA: T9SS type A sorting domain-containing protein [Ohtaekwangia sp.]